MPSITMVEHTGTANGNHICTVILLYIAIITLYLSCDFRIVLFLNPNHMPRLIYQISKFDTKHENLLGWTINCQLNLKTRPYHRWPMYGEKEEIRLPSPWTRLKV